MNLPSAERRSSHCLFSNMRIGNWFISAYSDDPLTVLAMWGIGLAASP